jgi:hypothetical protein
MLDPAASKPPSTNPDSLLVALLFMAHVLPFGTRTLGLGEATAEPRRASRVLSPSNLAAARSEARPEGNGSTARSCAVKVCAPRRDASP